MDELLKAWKDYENAVEAWRLENVYDRRASTLLNFGCFMYWYENRELRTW